MPIDLTQLTSPTQAGFSKHCRPSYFYKTLTGVGKKSGVINDKVDTLKAYNANAVYNHLHNFTFPLTETHPKLLRFATSGAENAPSAHLPKADMAYNIKNNVTNYDQVKKYDYRNRQKAIKEVKRDIQNVLKS